MQTVLQKFCVFKTANTTIVENDFPRQVTLEALTILVCEDETHAQIHSQTQLVLYT